MLRWLCPGIALLIVVTHAPAETVTRRWFKTSDGVQLSYLEAGARQTGNAKPVLALVTGWSMPAEIWRHQLSELGSRYHTLAIDPRGQGESEVPASGYTAERRATDLKEFLEPHARVLLVGWSLGAIESLQYIHMFGADRLAGLVLVDSSVGEEPAPKTSSPFKQQLRQNRDRAVAQFVRAIFAKPRSEKEYAALERGAKRIALDDSLALLDYPFERGHWRTIARNFEKPLLYVVTPQFEAQAIHLKKHRPATQVEIFRRAGHALFADEPARFNALIEKFAKKATR
ncbi:MAG TPA: alpha/beta hydrolase [Candidatus Binatia bacterium]|nr:alpha/beta hydrolase [Candidatus Binatia bacterium]